MSHTNDSDGTVLAPDEAFAVLGNETRMDILRTLWEMEEPLSFSDLRDAIGARDPGRFHYHLDQLTDHFVKQTDTQYKLQGAGKQVIRAVLAGAITENPTFGPTELESKCPHCGGDAEAWYANERFTARCRECAGLTERAEYPSGTFMEYSFPPAGIVDRNPDEILAVAHVLYDAKITAMFERVCPECAARVDFEFEICSDHEQPERGLCETCENRREVWIRPECQNCRYFLMFPAWFAVATNPSVVAFYDDHGVPWDRVPFSKLTWENAPYVADITEEVLSREPPIVRITIPIEGDELHVNLDHELNITEVQLG